MFKEGVLKDKLASPKYKVSVYGLFRFEKKSLETH
jgi:hypothetical protein